MPESKDLHGNAPDKSNVALLLIDIISDFEFADGEKLFNHALPMARTLADLKQKAKRAAFRQFMLMTISANGSQTLNSSLTTRSTKKSEARRLLNF